MYVEGIEDVDSQAKFEKLGQMIDQQQQQQQQQREGGERTPLLINVISPHGSMTASSSLSSSTNSTTNNNNNSNNKGGSRQSITSTQLMIMLYFWTCGGPFGIESAVGAGGPLLTMVGIIFVCVFAALPQALMSAELSLMFTSNGGNILWIQKAFGNFLAFVNAQCYLISNMATMSTLIVLFVSYLPKSLQLNPYDMWGVRTGFMLVVMFVNFGGVRWMSRISFLLLIIMFSPFCIEVVMIIYYRKPIHYAGLIEIPPAADIDWKLLISTVVWSFGGFDSVGSVAGDVRGGKSTFLAGVIGSFPLVSLNYFIPIFINIIVDPNYNNWGEGYFAHVVYKEFSNWLGIIATTASAIANWGQATSGLAPMAWTVWAMAKGEAMEEQEDEEEEVEAEEKKEEEVTRATTIPDDVKSIITAKSKSPATATTTATTPAPKVPPKTSDDLLGKPVGRRSKPKSLIPFLPPPLAASAKVFRQRQPVAAIVFCGLVMLGLSALPFDFLVQLYTILRIFNLLCEFAALVWLRNIYPNAERPYVIPGGTFGVFLCVFPTVLIAFASVITSDMSVLITGGVTIVAVMLMWPGWAYCVKRFNLGITKPPPPPQLQVQEDQPEEEELSSSNDFDAKDTKIKN